MNIYLSHITALRFWRSWSTRRPLPLRDFHQMGKIPPASLFPASMYPSASVLRNCAVKQDAVQQILSQTAGVEELGEALRQSTDAFDVQPWHLLFPDKAGTRSSALLSRHRTSLSFPRCSFIEVAPNLFVCSPELVFVQLSASLSLGELLALGYELCGCYPRSYRPHDAFVRRPLTTPERLGAYAARLQNAHGAKQARVAAKQIRPRSASIMETEFAAAAFTSEVHGGLGIAPSLINASIQLSRKASSIAGCPTMTCDFYWPAANFGIEYNGRAFHADATAQDRDSRKRDGLITDGIEIMTVTYSQFQDIRQCTALLDRASARAGRPKRKRSAAHRTKHGRLRAQVRRFHRAHFPFPREK